MPATRGTEMPTAKQIALIHVARRELGLDDDQYRAVLSLYGGGVESSKELDRAGFDSVIAYFNRCGFRSEWMKRSYGARPGMATPAQINLIRDLWLEWSGSDDEIALNRWIERSFHVTTLRFLTPDVAGKAINGLRAMIARQKESGRLKSDR